jgi:type IV pilus assembly protein PilM
LARNQITTVDIGTNSVKIMQLGLTQTGLLVLNHGEKAYPRTSASDKVSDEVIIDTLTQLISEKNFKTKDVALSIPRQLITVKSLSGLPGSATDEDIDKMVPIQVEPELPFTLNEATYSIYNRQRSLDNMSLELVAAKRTSIDRYLNIADKAGLGLKSIIPSAFATYGVIFDQFKDSLANKNMAIADIGAGGTDICIIQHGRLAFSRSFTFGGNNLTQLFERNSGISYDDAELLKRNNASLIPDAEESLTLNWAENLANQINQSIRALTGKETNGGIDALWLCGGSCEIPGLDNYLSNKLGIEVKLLDQFPNIETSLVRDGDSIIHRRLTVNLGLGVIALAGKERVSTVDVNMLPLEILEKAKILRRRILIAAASFMAVLVFIGAVWLFVGWRNSKIAQYNAITKQLEKLEKDVVTIQAKEALEKSIMMDKIMVPYVTPLEILREMHEKMPNRERISLSSFDLGKNGKLIISLEAMSHADVGETVQILSDMKVADDKNLFSDVKNGTVSKITKDNRPILQVQITCTLNKESTQQSEKNEKDNKS